MGITKWVGSLSACQGPAIVNRMTSSPHSGAALGIRPLASKVNGGHGENSVVVDPREEDLDSDTLSDGGRGFLHSLLFHNFCSMHDREN